MGIAYDVFGTGRTAIKMTIGKYLEGAGVSGHYANSNPQLADAPDDAGLWHRRCHTRMDRHEWKLRARLRSVECGGTGYRATGGDVCGVMSNTNFGKNVLSNNFDAGSLNGRSSIGLEPGVTIQQQIGPRSSVDVTYSRRWFRGFSSRRQSCLAAI